MEDRPRFRTGPEKLGRPGLSGGLGKRGYGGPGTHLAYRKGEAGKPPPVRRRARALSQQPTSEALEALNKTLKTIELAALEKLSTFWRLRTTRC